MKNKDNLNSSRITGEVVEIDQEKVIKFFEGRVKTAKERDDIVAMTLQDSSPELAHKRDVFEKTTFFNLMKPIAGDNVLDLGCGIGRWTKVFADTVSEYCGIDAVPGLIESAREHFSTFENVKFLVSPLENLDIRRYPEMESHYNLVLCSGVLQYLNDEACEKFFQSLQYFFSKENCRILIRVAISISERLTLKDFWSSELDNNYNAVYRPSEDYIKWIKDFLVPLGFKIIEHRPLYPANMNNRKETMQYFYWLVRE